MDEPIIKTGFIDLDRIIGGLYPGELMVIGAPPSMGKTSFLAALIRNITWKHGTKGLLFSLVKPIDNFRKYLVSSIWAPDFHNKSPLRKIIRRRV